MDARDRWWLTFNARDSHAVAAVSAIVEVVRPTETHCPRSRFGDNRETGALVERPRSQGAIRLDAVSILNNLGGGANGAKYASCTSCLARGEVCTSDAPLTQKNANHARYAYGHMRADRGHAGTGRHFARRRLPSRSLRVRPLLPS
jgi:hypothetical protein